MKKKNAATKTTIDVWVPLCKALGRASYIVDDKDNERLCAVIDFIFFDENSLIIVFYLMFGVKQ